MKRGATLLLALALAGAAGCATGNGTVRGSGTLEVEEIDIASLVGGRLVRLDAREGDSVRVGDTLAVLDRGEVSAELEVQAAQAQAARAQARDLQSGSRPAEVLAARAERLAAEADRNLAQRDFERAQELAKQQVIAPAQLDQARAVRDASQARARAAAERERLAEQGFRSLQVTAARDAAAAAAAQLAGARSRAGELVLTAPAAGVVLLRSYEVGELVPAGAPVLTLGDPERVWMRVYVGAPLIPRVQLGAMADVRPIGAKRDYPGRVVEIATKAEFTPRAALTEEEQANLVFGVKILLDPSQGALKPGLPADARIRPRP